MQDSHTPFSDYPYPRVLISYGAEEIKDVVLYYADKLDADFPPTLFVLAGQDPISQKAKAYIDRVETIGVEVAECENAVHSFIESNNPESEADDDIVLHVQEAYLLLKHSRHIQNMALFSSLLLLWCDLSAKSSLHK